MAMISLSEYAIKHRKNLHTVSDKCRRGGFKTAVKIGRNWVIDEDEPYTDLRKKDAQGDADKQAKE